MIVAVCLKRLPTICADKIVHSFPVNIFYMSIPPFHSAFIRTELFLTYSWRLRDWLAAAKAELPFMSAAKRFYRVDRQSYSFRYHRKRHSL